MPRQLTTEDFKQSLNGHVAEKGAEIHQKYGPNIGWKELQRVLNDRACVRYPCEIVFDAAELNPGELAHPQPKGETPEDGFTMFVHPFFMTQLEWLPHLVFYQLVLVNYGAFASPDDAETFGAYALGISTDDYYRILCGLADQLGPIESPAAGCGCAGDSLQAGS